MSVETMSHSSRNLDLVLVVQKNKKMADGGAWTRICAKTVLSLLWPDDTFSVLSFADTVKVEQEPRAVDKDLQTVEPALRIIDQMEFDGTGSSLAAALEEGLKLLAPAQSSRVLVLLSDGVYTGKKPGGLGKTIPVFAWAPVKASMGDVLEKIATDTEGQYLFLPAPGQILELRKRVAG